MIKSLFTAEQVEDLKKEFVEFYINDMNTEQMRDWIRVVYLAEMINAQKMRSEKRLIGMMKTYMKYLHPMYLMKKVHGK